MQEFTWNINSRRTSTILRDLKALMHLWKNDVLTEFSKEVCERLKKSARSIGEYDGNGHMCFVKDTEKLDIIYDTKTLQVSILEITNTDNKKTKIYKPVKFPSRKLMLVITPRKKRTKSITKIGSS